MRLVIKPAARQDILDQIDYYLGLELTDVAERFVPAVEMTIAALLLSPKSGSPKLLQNVALTGLRT